MARFSAVVVTHDSAAELRELLDSVERRLDPPPELIVVDTDSSDDTLAVAEGRAEIVALGENPGFGVASNAGVARAGEGVTVLLNPDVELLDGGLADLAARARSRRALLAPRLLNADGSVQRSAHPLPGRPGSLLPALVHPRVMPRALRLRADPWRSQAPRRVGWAIGACLAARTDLLRELGPFDPRPFLFYEDMDLCLRAHASGVPTELHPDVRLRHAGAHSTQPAFGGEPYELLARRRREVVGARLGGGALLMDDLAEGLTFATRAAARLLLRRDSSAERARLAGLLKARRGT
ncbi:MAG TPA: glycosyltransferase family 2 protein [Thermoleophilaceae bacterium]